MSDQHKWEWFPIETAPKDGRKILLWRKNEIGDQYRVGWWYVDVTNNEGWYPHLATALHMWTHWCYLPDPPEV